MENDLRIIIKNIINPEQKLRNESESKINELANQNLGNLFFNLSLIICHENEDKIIRQISCTIIKSLISKEKYNILWFNIDEKLRNSIKNNLMSTLASNDIDIRKGTGLAISSICKIELPKKLWLNIFDILIGTSNNENINIQLSSIITLGYIFEEINENDISDEIMRKILFCYYNILNKDNINLELHKSTLDSLFHFIPFIKNVIMNNEQSKIFFELIEKSIKNDYIIIRSKSIKIFIEISRRYYDYLENYINNLIDFSSKIMEKDSIDNSLLAYEIWCSIGEIEEYRKKEYELNNNKKYNFFEFCQKSLSKIFPIITNHIQQTDYDNEEWNQRKASSLLINLFSKSCRSDFIEKIIEFIQKLVSQNNYDLMNAGLYTYSSILETFYHNNLISYNNEYVLAISNILCGNFPDHLKYISSYTLEKITFNYSDDIISDNKIFNNIMTLIINILDKQKNNVIINLCKTINNLLKEIETSENIIYNKISPFFESITNILINLGISSKSYDYNNNVALYSFMTVSNFIEHSAKGNIDLIRKIFKNLITLFNKTFDVSSFKNNEMRYNYQSYILICFSSFFSSSFFCIEENDILILFQNIIESFNDRKNIYEEGISLIGFIFIVISKNNFDTLINKFFDYLIIGLKTVNDISLCTSCIITTGKIIQNLQSDNDKYLNIIMENIFYILSNSEIDKSLKPISLNIISELFLNCKNYCFNYYEQSMNFIKSAMEVSIYIDKSKDDDDIINYFYQLRESIISCLTYIFNAVCENNLQNDFIKYLENIMKYINSICLNDENEIIFEESLGLIIDFYNQYQIQMKKLIDLNVMDYIYDKLKYFAQINGNDRLGTIIEYSKKKLMK